MGASARPGVAGRKAEPAAGSEAKDGGRGPDRRRAAGRRGDGTGGGKRRPSRRARADRIPGAGAPGNRPTRAAGDRPRPAPPNRTPRPPTPAEGPSSDSSSPRPPRPPPPPRSPRPNTRPAPHRYPGPTGSALRANPYPEVTDPTCRLPLRRLVLTRQRLFTLETCCGYGYGPARNYLRLARVFKGRRGLSRRRIQCAALSRAEASISGRTHSRGPRALSEKRELSRAPSPASPGSFASPPQGATRRPSPQLRVRGSEPDSLSIGRGHPTTHRPALSERRSPIP